MGTLRVCLVASLFAGACGSSSSKAAPGTAEGPAEPAPAAAAAPAASTGSLGGETTGGFAPLIEVGTRLNRFASAYRDGHDVTAVLAPFVFEGDEGVRLELEHAGAVHVTHLGFELELLFFHKGRGRYYVRALVHAGPEGVSFLRLGGHAQIDGKLGVRGTPFESWTGAGEPFAAAGRELLARLRSPQCSALPLVDPARLRAVIPDDAARSVIDRELTDSKAKLAATCAGMAETAGTEVQLRIDDHIFVVRAADGTALGLIKGNLKYRPDGTVALDLGRYRPFTGQSSRQP
jgi:hypothetical protein